MGGQPDQDRSGGKSFGITTIWGPRKEAGAVTASVDSNLF
ncbi:MAG: hypothetical protein CM1200mP41_10350 [Gammaproteobacteria bacterium]|nr:MAG: hypothetical protein CM1200mP41_10350 [Gammaproteobacteria bacterium]